MKAALVLAIALFISSVAALSESQYQDAFLSWTRQHNKVYASQEFNSRYMIFKNNLDYINQWNSQNTDTILGATVFADLTNEEYRKLLLGTHFDGSARLAAAPKFVEEVAAPDSINWVTKGAVTPIKNQGQCGSCWSFSTTGSVEGATFIAKGNLVSLSEQNLIDCSGSFGNNGCNGGLMDNAFRYIKSNGGIDTEASYPYTASVGKCKYTVANRGATVSGYSDVSAGSESALLNAVAKGPVSVAIDASHNSFQLYSSGVYYEAACSSTALDHGVLAVGYGSAGTGKDYWIVKNSWGTSWGQAGYIWMARNRSNNCGIATMASYPTV